MLACAIVATLVAAGLWLPIGDWLRSAAMHWLTGVLYLVLWAGLFHIARESLLLALAHAAPERTGGARRIAERAATALYYVSVPAMLAVRFLS